MFEVGQEVIIIDEIMQDEVYVPKDSRGYILELAENGAFVSSHGWIVWVNLDNLEPVETDA